MILLRSFATDMTFRFIEFYKHFEKLYFIAFLCNSKNINSEGKDSSTSYATALAFHRVLRKFAFAQFALWHYQVTLKYCY